MTIANGMDSPVNAMSAWRRFWTNVGTALTVLVRPPRIRPERQRLLPAWPFLIAGMIGIALLVAGMAYVDSVTSIAASRLPRWVIDLFEELTDFGLSGWFLWPLGVLFLVLAALPPLTSRFAQLVLASVMVRVGFLFTAIAIPGLFVTIVKRMIGRARPGVTGQADPFAFAPFIWRPEYASLPSGHSTTAFAVLIAFGTLWPRWRPLFLAYALTIAVSRVVVTAHYPTDVVAGALTGIAGALLVRRHFALRRLGFSVSPAGTTQTYPAPSFRRIKALVRRFL